MANALLPAALWDLIEPLLPIPEDRPEGGRPRRSDRACLTGILFVLRSGIPWRMLEDCCDATGALGKAEGTAEEGRVVSPSKKKRGREVTPALVVSLRTPKARSRAPLVTVD